MEKSMQELFTDSKTIAVVGLSAKSSRTSHRIGKYLQEKGYRIIPVNPNEESVLGERCYSSLLDIPEDIKIDIVNVFRRSEFLEGVARETVERGAGFLWAQLGVYSREAENVLKSAGVPFIMNSCIFVEHQSEIY